MIFNFSCIFLCLSAFSGFLAFPAFALAQSPSILSASLKACSVGKLPDATCQIPELLAVNEAIIRPLQTLVEQPFFRFYKVDLYRECPFWVENGLCMNRDCGVATADEESIPEKWRSDVLGSLVRAEEDCEEQDTDFCLLDDHVLVSGEYVDLVANPERFTGYAGESAKRVWGAIYEENCFGIPGLDNAADLDMLGAQKESDVCLEKRVYWRLISGMHASISSHICAEWLNQETGQWSFNQSCFLNRLAVFPERLNNMYFAQAILLRALVKVKPWLEAYDVSNVTQSNDVGVLESPPLQDPTVSILHNILNILSSSAQSNEIFDETELFQGPDADELKMEFKHHFRNVSRIMDCVGCDKCRLWGKVQITGLGTALKILFELDETMLNPTQNPHLLQRTEVVALLNTAHRLSESLQSVSVFRKLHDTETIDTLKAYNSTNTTLYETVLTLLDRTKNACYGWCQRSSLYIKRLKAEL